MDGITSDIAVDHSADIIRLDSSAFDHSHDITHSTTSLRVIRLVSKNSHTKSQFKTYREQMIFDPMFPVMEWIIREEKPVFL